MADIDDLVTPPNAGAYEQDEVRRGPPLSYVGEKLRSSLNHVHGLCSMIREAVPDTLPIPSNVKVRPFSVRNDGLLVPADAAFYNALVAFLALYNSLGRLGEWEAQEDKIRALRGLTSQEIEAWLDSVESGGSVT